MNELNQHITEVYTDYSNRNKVNQSNFEKAYDKQDALQDSVLRLLEKQADEEKVVNVGSDIEARKLFATITKNLSIDKFRRNDTATAYTATAYTETLKQTSETHDTPDDNEWMINHIISNLDDTEQDVFMMYYVEGYKGTEIAEKLEIEARQAQRIVKRISNKIMRLNISDLVDTRFVFRIAGMEKHKLDTNHNKNKKDCPNTWEHWQGQSDYSDYEPTKTSKYNIVSDNPLNADGLYVFLKSDSYSDMLGVDIS